MLVVTLSGGDGHSVYIHSDDPCKREGETPGDCERERGLDRAGCFPWQSLETTVEND